MKYMGSKNRIAKHILPIMLKYKTPEMTWVEPFVGGANMIDKVEGNRIGADNNKYLIALWKALQSGWEMPINITREDRLKCMENMEAFEPHLVGWIGFGCCYNGVFFGGYAGKITTKEGNERNYIAEAVRNINNQLPNLQDVSFICEDYNKLQIPENSLIYCDPPYQNTAKYKTGDFNHNEFWDWCRQKANEGHTVFVSEYNAPNDFYCVFEKEVTTCLNTTKKDTERLFTPMAVIADKERGIF